jgi:ceramide synthetase
MAAALHTTINDFLVTSYGQIRAATYIPLASYIQFLPKMKNGETPGQLEGEGFPLFGDLIDGVLIAIGLTLLRVVLTYLISQHVGRWIMKHSYYRMARDERLEAFLQKDLLPSRSKIAGMAKESKSSPASVAAYCRRARNRLKEEKTMHKFNEVMWKLLCHVFLTLYGAWAVLSQERWWYDVDSCWELYPHMINSRAAYWYYMFEFGTFGHEMLALFWEVKRSDFWAMFTHHVATLVLIAGSYTCNFLPIGCLVMMAHDLADFFLEVAKVFNYMVKARPWAQKITDVFFVLFALVFFVTRLVIFPIYIWWENSMKMPRKYFGYHYVGMAMLNMFCLVLIMLHTYWMYLIVRMAVKMLASGEAPNDERSDDEDEELEGSGGEKED